MRRSAWKTCIVVTLVLAGCASAGGYRSRGPSGGAAVASPQLFFKPSPVFDAECANKSGFKVDPAWYPELNRRVPEFQAAWDARAPALIGVSETLAGAKFTRSEYSVTLTICRWTPMGYPFIISLRPFLKISAEADPQIRTPLTMSEFGVLTHHELLHSLTDDIVMSPSFPSPLLLKHQTERPNVLVHLHLLALQKAAYAKVGDAELLKNADALYAYIGNDYQRAWDIVAAEGADAFVKELQDFSGMHR
jgi:hypothetical protein